MEAKNNKARIEAGRKELLQMWYSSALDIMDSMLEDFEYHLEVAEREYISACNSDDWEEDEEKRKKIVSLLKRRLAAEVEALALRREEVRCLKKSGKTLLKVFKCDEKSTKSNRK